MRADVWPRHSPSVSPQSLGRKGLPGPSTEPVPCGGQFPHCPQASGQLHEPWSLEKLGSRREAHGSVLTRAEYWDGYGLCWIRVPTCLPPRGPSLSFSLCSNTSSCIRCLLFTLYRSRSEFRFFSLSHLHSTVGIYH